MKKGIPNHTRIQAVLTQSRFRMPELAPPIGCAITLAAPGIGGSFGASALDISGQTASITLPASPAAQYAASQDASVTINWTGERRAIEFANAAAGSWTWVARGFVNDPPSIDAVWRWNPGTTDWTIVVNGVVQATYAGSATDTVALVVDENGNIEFWLAGTLRNTIAVYSAGAIIRPLTLTEGGVAGDTMSSGFVTNGANMGAYSGALDWCGQ